MVQLYFCNIGSIRILSVQLDIYALQIQVPYSRDYIENTTPTGAKMIPYFKIENLQSPTLYRGTYLLGT